MTKKELQKVQQEIQETINMVNYMISSTPTSPLRNELCDTNIHLQAARSHFERASILAI